MQQLRNDGQITVSRVMSHDCLDASTALHAFHVIKKAYVVA
jgi:hypothetical protein